MEASMKLYHLSKENIIAEKVEIADSFFARAMGLMWRNSMEEKSALWIKSGTHIHTMFMRFSIDLIFVDKNLKVKKVYTRAKPWRHFFTGTWSANSVFELPEGSLSQLNVNEGDQLYVGT